MPRKLDLERFKVIHGDPLVTLAQTRVPLDRPLPPKIKDEDDNANITAQNEDPGRGHWKDLLGVLENARGCEYVACSRVAEDSESVLFVIVWWNQECLDKFKASPNYAVFLVSLGMLDLPGPNAGGASCESISSSRAIQTVKFFSRTANGSTYLQGWLFFYTVTLPHPVTDAQRELFESQRLEGPHYPDSNGDFDMTVKRINPPESNRQYGVQHGWAQELRQITSGGPDSNPIRMTVQDGVIYEMWLSKEAEEAMKTAIPGVELSWDDELREIGAVEVREEHVNLVCVAFGRHHRKVVLPVHEAGETGEPS